VTFLKSGVMSVGNSMERTTCVIVLTQRQLLVFLFLFIAHPICTGGSPPRLGGVRALHLSLCYLYVCNPDAAGSVFSRLICASRQYTEVNYSQTICIPDRLYGNLAIRRAIASDVEVVPHERL
jgi:hypothetical protein